MAGKEDVIKKVAIAKPSLKPLPQIPDFEVDGLYIDNFITSMKANHGKVVFLSDYASFSDLIIKEYPGKELSVSTIQELISEKEINIDSLNLKNIDLAVLRGNIAVGENAAIWVPESNLPHRAVPFVCEHLILIIEKDNIVGNMHEAYNKIRSLEGYGVFISGPSKTADIEQSLVIGAHGPRSLLVVIE